MPSPSNIYNNSNQANFLNQQLEEDFFFQYKNSNFFSGDESDVLSDSDISYFSMNTDDLFSERLENNNDNLDFEDEARFNRFF